MDQTPIEVREYGLDVILSDPESPQNKKTKKKRPVLKFFARFFAFLFIMAGSAAALAYGAARELCLGPSPAARDLFVISCEETSAAKFVPRLFLSEEDIQAIFTKNTVLQTKEVTEQQAEFTDPPQDSVMEDISLVDVYGPTFKGKMLIIQDPSRVKLVTLPAFDEEVNGKRVEAFVSQSGAVAGINAGGFEDENGVGNGGMPIGLVITGGALRNGSLLASYDVIGFDAEHRLIVGRMTGQEALNRGIRDAVSFGPVFVVNGKPSEVVGYGGGLNPRTVIGQRADGAVLMLVIDGRQPSSLGANFKDCIDVMIEFEAINAANLDGGSSSIMVYEGEVVNVCASLYGSRFQPGAFVVI